MKRALVVVATLCGSTFAAAAPRPSFDEFIATYLPQVALTGTTDRDTEVPRLAVLDSDTRVDTAYADYYAGADASFDVTRKVVGWSADKQAAWITADLPETAGGMGGAPMSVIATDHAIAVVVGRATSWHVVAFSVRATLPDREQAAALKDGTTPPKLARKIDPGAEAAAKLFEATLADPKAFAASVSGRAETVLQGSDKTDRAEGGKAVAATLLQWNLKLALRDGLQAGTAGKTLAWVAANVDASPAGKPGTKPTPYQIFTVYEHAGTSWKLVAASFAFFTGR